MKPPDESDAERRVEQLLQEWTEDQACVERQKEENPRVGDARMWDFRVQLRDETLVGEYERSGDIPTIARAIEQLKEGVRQRGGDSPLLIVPFMGEKALGDAGRRKSAGLIFRETPICAPSPS